MDLQEHTVPGTTPAEDASLHSVPSEEQKRAQRAARESEFAVTMPLPAEITFGHLEAPEINLLLSSWKDSYRWAKAQYAGPVYHTGMEKMIAALAIAQRLIVARGVGMPADRDILGWICFRERAVDDPALVVHYTYVKNAYRRQGLAKRLAAQAGWRGLGDTVIGSHKWRCPVEVRKKFRIYLNEFLVMAGHV